MREKLLSIRKIIIMAVFAIAVWSFAPAGASNPARVVSAAKAASATDSKIKLSVAAKGIYKNWEGVSNVSEFTDEQGNYCYAFYRGRTITIVKNKKNGKVKSKITIKMQKPLFGAVTCDQDGNFYVVTGKTNSSFTDKTKNTVFIAKYSKNGDLLATVGDNGSGCYKNYRYSGLDEDSNTREPFAAGNCDIAVNGNYVAVNYARHMYNGHQSNTAIILNRHTMQLIQLTPYYNSHSFAQRAIPYQDGFILASEGDAYDRAFSIAFITPTEDKIEEEKNKEDDGWYHPTGYRDDYNSEPYSYEPLEESRKTYTKNDWIYTRSYNIFHFWVKKNCESNMFVVNNNYAHMGGIAAADINHVALVGTSVKAMNKKADKQKECLFIQIFDPAKDVKKPEAYAISGSRSGKTGIDGNEDATDYGIRWLTNGKFEVRNPQVVADHKGRFVILFEKYVGYSNAGVFYTIINSDGTTAKKITRFPGSANLNPCETPKVCGKYIFWTANKPGSGNLFTYKLKIK